ncbi:MAG TPA: HD domain-containing protein [Fimbriimonadaceae bacterium]|nr:HD domain-containing protein [Fimbriimonadaceae bacterium]
MGTPIEKAIRLAYKAHKGQFRDGEAPLPYISHPLDVLNNLRYVGRVTDEDVLAAGVLHDTLEETDLHPETIFKELGGRVLDLVIEVTREEPDFTGQGLTDEEIWHLRSNLLLEEITRMSDDAKRIKLADRISNLEGAYATRTGDKLSRYVKQSEWILERIERDISPPMWDAIKVLVDLSARD